MWYAIDPFAFHAQSSFPEWVNNFDQIFIDPETNHVSRRGIIHLEAGGNFRLGVRQFGLAPLMTLLQRFGLPEVSSLYFENRLARLWAE